MTTATNTAKGKTMSKFWLRMLAGLAVLALVATACGNDDDDQPDGADAQPTADATAAPEPDETAAPAPAPGGDVELVIGRVMPETGALAFLAPPMVEGARLAVEDIQAAGGAVSLLTGDTGTDPDVAVEAVNRLLGEGAHVIVGAAASGISQSFIQTLYDARVPQCSPSNTSPSFSTQDNAGYYFRTVPPDEAVSPIIANVVAADGATNVAIVARADDYGSALAGLMESGLDDFGVASQVILYSPDETSFDATLGEVSAMGADAVVLISFSEGAQIIRGALEAGVPASVMYGADGIFDPNLAAAVDPSDANVLDGMKLIGAAGGAEFSDRLAEITDGNVIYGGQAYDCVVVMALAALAAGSTDGTEIINQVQAVTGGGTKCTTYEQCAGLLADGADIDYDGVSGPLDLDAVGDPTWGRYIIAQFQDGALVPIDSQDVNLGAMDEDPGDGAASGEQPELVIGRVMPETGALAFLAPPMVEGARLAVEDIQAAGGAVSLLTGDTGTDPDVAVEAVNRLLGEGAHVIVGAAASGISQSFIQTLYDARVPQCSPSNTSPSFSTQDNAGYYFRTVPPDEAVSPIIANVVAADGATNVAIVARADDYGSALAGLMESGLDDFGVASQVILYSPDETSFDATLGEVSAMGADAVVLISFSEGAQIIRGALEAGVPASVMYGADGIFDPNLAAAVDPSDANVLDGMKLIGAAGGAEFSDRLAEITDGNVIYGGQAYDCVVVMALAALAAGSTDGTEIINQVQAVTGGGTKCTTYEQCAGLLADGADIDYDGVSGPLDLDAVGDPTWGRYIIAQFQDGALVPIDSQDVDLDS